MKRVGIVTFTTGFNYGNRLQNYAVQEIVRNFGFCAETICDNEVKFYVLKKHIKHIISKIYSCLTNINVPKLTEWERKTSFDKFNDSYINFSRLNLFNDKELKKNMDSFEYFVTGSDQVWNPFFINSDNYLLAFAPDNRKVAFSASIGINELPIKVREKYKNLISRIGFVSVREERAAKIIEELGLKKPVVLVDPTLVLEKERWIELVDTSKIDIEKKYILCYFLGEQTIDIKKEIQRLSKELNCEVINLLDDKRREYFSLGPADFLKLINGAEVVITDSFHGTVFSILFHKSFFVFNRKCVNSMESRIDTLLKTLGFQNRKINAGENICLEDIENLNFYNSDSIIEFERKKAYNFLAAAFHQG